MGVIDFIEHKEFLTKYFLDLFKNNLNNISFISVNRQQTYTGSGKNQSIYDFKFNVTLQYSFKIKEVDNNTTYLYVSDSMNNREIIRVPITTADLGGHSISSIYYAFGEMRTEGDFIEKIYNNIARKEKLIKIKKNGDK